MQTCFVHLEDQKLVLQQQKKVKKVRQENISVIVCISPQHGLINYSNHIRGATAEKYCNFLKELLKELPCTYENCILIMNIQEHIILKMSKQ